MKEIYEHLVWLNPTPQQHWAHTPSVGVVQEIIGGRMVASNAFQKVQKEIAIMKKLRHPQPHASARGILQACWSMCQRIA